MKFGKTRRSTNVGHEASLAVADQSTERVKDGSNQVKVKGKDVIKILSVEFEGIDRVNSLYGMNSRITIKSGHSPKGLRFTYLTDYSPVTFDRHTAL